MATLHPKPYLAEQAVILPGPPCLGSLAIPVGLRIPPLCKSYLAMPLTSALRSFSCTQNAILTGPQPGDMWESPGQTRETLHHLGLSPDTEIGLSGGEARVTVTVTFSSPQVTLTYTPNVGNDCPTPAFSNVKMPKNHLQHLFKYKFWLSRSGMGLRVYPAFQWVPLTTFWVARPYIIWPLPTCIPSIDLFSCFCLFF